MIMDRDKKWGITLLVLVGVCLAGIAGLTAVVDPFFHYHKPLECLSYPLNNERYQNDGIVKHFDYDAVITGTSMTLNFKASELDELFGVHSVKVAFPGAMYKEINDNLEKAVAANPDIRLVVRGLDKLWLLEDADKTGYDKDSYPYYLYDDVLYNDVYYVLNKDVLCSHVKGVLGFTCSGQKSTDFDTYGNWMHAFSFGKDAVDAVYHRADRTDEIQEVTEADFEMLRENLSQNVTDLAKAHPEIDFYLFLTPYSIYYWDNLNQTGTLKKQLAIEEEAIRLLVEQENIYLFAFSDLFEMICDLDHYKDEIHYSEEINSQILKWMSRKEHLLTKENYREYCGRIYEFYMTYDYEALFMPEE